MRFTARITAISHRTPSCGSTISNRRNRSHKSRKGSGKVRRPPSNHSRSETGSHSGSKVRIKDRSETSSHSMSRGRSTKKGRDTNSEVLDPRIEP